MSDLGLEDHVATLHRVARAIGGAGKGQDFTILAQRTRDLADELADVLKRTRHPERYPVSLQNVMEKKRVIDKLRGAHAEELWQRKRDATRAELKGAVMPDETEARCPDESGFLEFHPLLAFGPIDQLLLADNLFFMARRDYEASLQRGNTDLERDKRAASTQMMKDALARAMQGLEHWSELLEAVPVPEVGL